ncbi:MAG: cyclic nucleotide-binding domain-containing protein [Acidobacteria bacterium]|nr:cyclic nucleotide-binding domain-containing protein [Acidobacteriota bacterium]
MADPFKNLQVEYKKGELVYNDGNNASVMFVVSSGSVKLFKKDSTDQQIDLGIYQKGDIFGELGVIKAGKRYESAVAMEDTRVVVINREMFMTLIRKNPEIAVKMIRKFSERLSDATQKIDELVKRTGFRKSSDMFALLKVLGSDQVFPLALKRNLIGRYDPTIGICPDIDISMFDPQKTVSRKHAVVLRENGESFLEEEMGVINGTYLNGEKLESGRRYPVTDGDRIHFGLVACEYSERIDE